MRVAIPFYTRDNFVKIAALLPDADWPKTYEEWLKKTEMGERGIKLSGNVPVRVNVEPAAFEAWCKDNKQPIVRNSILNFCLFILAWKITKAKEN
jgi:hypothetical protein